MYWTENIHPEAQPFKVLLKRGVFTDHARNGREVPYKIYYPVLDKQQTVPVIFWSHGFGGNRDGASFLSRFLASHGYVLVHLTHPGTDSSLWEGKPGHPWDILQKAKISREATLHRFRDVPFALDALHQWREDNPEIGAIMDMEQLGMSGHSFGAMTTQVIAGQHVPDEAGKLIQVKDERFKAGITYSPVPITHMTDAPHEDVYGSIDRPIFHMTGTDDSSPLESFEYDHRFLIYDHTRAADKYLLVKEKGDHMVYNGTRGKLEANPLRDIHEAFIKIGALAFWDAYLKNDEDALNWLAEGGMKTYIGEAGEFRAER